MSKLHSYTSAFNLGHRALTDLFDGPVVVQEKVDGSQLSFGINAEGELLVRSKGQAIVLDAPPKMFEKAVAAVQSIRHLLTPGWTYRGEYLEKPKHNTLAYERTPTNYIILFDVDTGLESYLSPGHLDQTAKELGLEVVPVLWAGPITPEKLVEEWTQFWSKRLSVLGNVPIEGIVIKNHARFNPEKKMLSAKLVSEEFKEKHGGDWKKRNPNTKDVVANIIGMLRTEARWRKAVQHLTEAGVAKGEVQDIGPLLKELSLDVLKDEEAEIRDLLFKHFWPIIARGFTAGFPDWYKALLAGTESDVFKKTAPSAEEEQT